MIKEYPNGDSVEIKGLTVTVKLGDESMSKIRKAALDEIDTLRDENAKLRELVQGLWFAAQYLGMNPDGATGSGFVRQMRKLGIEVEDA